MLEPNARLLYLEELRPPEGYLLDRAIATTYTLDLLSLLMAPLSMVLYESQGKDELIREPMAVLEALRRTAGRIGVFCQKGHMSVSKHQQLLYNFLENAVVEVNPLGNGGVFHPKTWLIRFFSNDAPVIYRFLCLSRNLTFDRSWDTVLALEGELKDRQRAFGRNHPLGDFIKTLPTLSPKEISPTILEHVNLMAEEVRRVQFTVPPPFKDDGSDQSLTFVPIGIEGHKKGFKIEKTKSLLIISPFLSEGWLKREITKSSNVVLVSRSETLNSLSDKTYSFLVDHGVELYVMDESAEPLEESAGEVSETQFNFLEEKDLDDFSGLHAKLFVLEKNYMDVQVWTGSANATTPAFKGKNVEFMVRLNGKASEVGSKKILGTSTTLDDSSHKNIMSLIDLLQPYQRPKQLKEADTVKAELEASLDNARKTICHTQLKLLAVPYTERTYTLKLISETAWSLDQNTIVFCAPISLHKNNRKKIDPLFKGEVIEFRNLPPARLTRFVEFAVTARLESRKLTSSFVLKLDCEGLPGDRDQQVLGSIISDSDRFFKYLLFLLSGTDASSSEHNLLKILNDTTSSKNKDSPFSFGIPLFEEMVRSFSREPKNIDRINDLIEELKKCDSSRVIIPADFMQLWQIFLGARQIKGGHEKATDQTKY